MYTDREIQEDGDDNGCGDRSAHILRLSSRCRPDVPAAAAAAVVRAFAHGRTSRVTLAPETVVRHVDSVVCESEANARARQPSTCTAVAAGVDRRQSRRGARKRERKKRTGRFADAGG